jgi:hypothetical protein
MSAIHFCSPTSFSFRSMRYCKWCGERRRHLMTDELWYGMKIVCLGCGSTWTTEWGHHRLSQNKRHDARDKARLRWKEAGTRAQHTEWLEYEFSLMREDQDADD